jgi:hypothetical protein
MHKRKESLIELIALVKNDKNLEPWNRVQEVEGK